MREIYFQRNSDFFIYFAQKRKLLMRSELVLTYVGILGWLYLNKIQDSFYQILA